MRSGCAWAEAPARMAPDEVPYMCSLLWPVSCINDRDLGLEVLDPARDVGAVAGAAGVAVAVVVNGPDERTCRGAGPRASAEVLLVVSGHRLGACSTDQPAVATGMEFGRCNYDM
jgi:hypothetical protein